MWFRLLRLQCFEGGLLHGGTGGGFAGPDFELPHGLLYEHLDTGDGDLLLLLRAANERRLERIVDQIENDIGGNGALEKAAFDLREHTDRSRVDHGVKV